MSKILLLQIVGAADLHPPAFDLLALVKYLVEEAREEKVFENQKIIKTPIVRNGKQATVGYKPEEWKNWL